MFVKDIMTRSPVITSPEATLRELLTLMTDKTYEAIPVKRDGRVVGIVTDWDVLVNSPLARDLSCLDTTTVADIMSRDAVTVYEDEVVEMAAYLMYFHDLDAVPVLNHKDDLVGIVTQSDLFRTFVMLLGLRSRGTTITLEMEDRVGALAEITGLVRDAGISIASVSTFMPPDRRRGNVILRVRTGNVSELVERLSKAGFTVTHVSRVWQ